MANFGRNDERQWQAKHPGLRLPTYRMVNYWADAGAFGPDKRRPGSGHYRRWTEHELSKLAAMCEISDALHEVDLQLTVEIVRRLWPLLDQASVATLRVGCVAITASLPETGEQP